MLLWWLPLFFFFSLVPVAGFGCPSLSLDYMRTHMHKHPTWVSLSLSPAALPFSLFVCPSLSMCVTMLNALTQWSESTRLGFITPSSWCTTGGGAERLSLSVFVLLKKKMDSNEVVRVVVVVPVFFGSVQMEAMPSCWESEQKHPRGGDGGGPPYLKGGQWERRVKEATKNRRGRERRHSRGWGHPKKTRPRFCNGKSFLWWVTTQSPTGPTGPTYPRLAFFPGILISFGFLGAPPSIGGRWYAIAYTMLI